MKLILKPGLTPLFLDIDKCRNRNVWYMGHVLGHRQVLISKRLAYALQNGQAYPVLPGGPRI